MTRRNSGHGSHDSGANDFENLMATGPTIGIPLASVTSSQRKVGLAIATPLIHESCRAKHAVSHDRLVQSPHRVTIPSLFVFFIAVLILGLFGLQGDAREGNLADTDAYSWANRVVELREGGWFDETIDDVSPDGVTQHWSRPFDVLVLAGAAALAPLTGFAEGIRLWAFVLPVILGSATVLMIWRAFAPLIDRRAQAVLAFLTVCQASFIFSFSPGRIDHQALYVPVVVWLIVAASRHVLREGSGRIRQGVFVGLIASLSLWVAMETILAVGAVLAVYGLRWAFQSEASLEDLAAVLAGLVIGTSGALVVENGASAFDSRMFDELSIIFPTFFALALVAVFFVSRVDLSAGRPRLVSAISAALVCAGLMIVLFPTLKGGPLGDVDPFYAEIRLTNIAEIQSVFAGTPRETIARFTQFWFFVPIALGTVVAAVRSKQRRRLLSSQGAPWQFLTALFVVYAPLTLWQIRWSPLLAVATAPLAAVAIGRVLPRGREVVQLGIAFIISLSWMPVVGLAGSRAAPTCDRKALREVTDLYLQTDDGVVLAMTDYGPQLLFETEYRVLSIPNHRYQKGFEPSYQIMNSSDDAFQRSLVDQYDVKMVLVCTSEVDSKFYRARPDSLHDRLQDGDAPSWLTEVGTSTEVDGIPFFRLFKVIAPEDAG